MIKSYLLYKSMNINILYIKYNNKIIKFNTKIREIQKDNKTITTFYYKKTK